MSKEPYLKADRVLIDPNEIDLDGVSYSIEIDQDGRPAIHTEIRLFLGCETTFMSGYAYPKNKAPDDNQLDADMESIDKHLAYVDNLIKALQLYSDDVNAAKIEYLRAVRAENIRRQNKESSAT